MLLANAQKYQQPPLPDTLEAALAVVKAVPQNGLVPFLKCNCEDPLPYIKKNTSSFGCVRWRPNVPAGEYNGCGFMKGTAKTALAALFDKGKYTAIQRFYVSTTSLTFPRINHVHPLVAPGANQPRPFLTTKTTTTKTAERVEGVGEEGMDTDTDTDTQQQHGHRLLSASAVASPENPTIHITPPTDAMRCAVRWLAQRYRVELGLSVQTRVRDAGSFQSDEDLADVSESTVADVCFENMPPVMKRIAHVDFMVKPLTLSAMDKMGTKTVATFVVVDAWPPHGLVPLMIHHMDRNDLGWLMGGSATHAIVALDNRYSDWIVVDRQRLANLLSPNPTSPLGQEFSAMPLERLLCNKRSISVKEFLDTSPLNHPDNVKPGGANPLSSRMRGANAAIESFSAVTERCASSSRQCGMCSHDPTDVVPLRMQMDDQPELESKLPQATGAFCGNSLTATFIKANVTMGDCDDVFLLARPSAFMNFVAHHGLAMPI
ncbi:MAG: hypothetical protein WC763_05330 [Candidatus Paceibacterota bacterium]|jgi:hypothetical protein